MRVLFGSTRGAGHFNPLVPFANAVVRAGRDHDPLVYVTTGSFPRRCRRTSGTPAGWPKWGGRAGR